MAMKRTVAVESLLPDPFFSGFQLNGCFSAKHKDLPGRQFESRCWSQKWSDFLETLVDSGISWTVLVVWR